MENNLFREAKENWHLEDAPKCVCTALHGDGHEGAGQGFFDVAEEQARLHASGEETTREMYCRKLKMLSRDKLIVFVGSYFWIFLSHEVIMLVDVPVHKTAKELGVTRSSIYTKYTGLSPP